VSLTQAERIQLIESDHLDVALRVEVLSDEGETLGEIDVDSFKVRHDSDADGVHRHVVFTTTDELAWQRQRARPWVTVSNSRLDLEEEVALGVFVLTDPKPDSMLPPTYTVTGYDLLYLLDQKLLEPVSQPTGQPVLFAVRQVLARYGVTADRIDNSRAEDVLLEPKVWPVEFDGTALDAINELLACVGYRPLYMDPEGFARSEPAVPIDQRPPSWRYDAQSDTTTVLAEGRDKDQDYTDAPNFWMFWRADVVRDDPPVIGDGLYVVRNENVGPASISARGGVVVRSDNDGPLEALSQDDLIANADRIVAEETHAVTAYTFQTEANPYHQHDQVLEVLDVDYGLAGRFRHLSWEFDIVARTVTHTATAILGGIT